MTTFSGMTLSDFLTELGEACGALASDGGLPTGYELEKLKRKINRGLRLLYQTKPNGWNVLTRQVSLSLTIDGTGRDALRDAAGDLDPSRVLLPPGIAGQPINGWSWSDLTGNLSGPVESTTLERVVRNLNTSAGMLSHPQMIATEVYVSQDAPQGSPTGMPAVRWAARVFPKPDRAYTLLASFSFGPSDMVLLEDRSCFGELLDEAVLAAAKWAWVSDDAEDPRHGAWQQAFELAAARAKSIDAQHSPTTIGPISGHNRATFTHTIADLTFNGSAVNP